MPDPYLTSFRTPEAILDDAERDRMNDEDLSIRAQEWYLDDIERSFAYSRMSDADRAEYSQRMHAARGDLAAREAKLAADREWFAGRDWRRTRAAWSGNATGVEGEKIDA